MELFIPVLNLIDLQGKCGYRNQPMAKLLELPQIIWEYETMIGFLHNRNLKYTNPEEGTINGW